eukprot:EG_transcript_1282
MTGPRRPGAPSVDNAPAPQFQALELQGYGITSLHGLGIQPALERLHLENNRVKSLDGLDVQPNLRELHLQGNGLKHFRHGRPQPKLEVLGLAGNPIARHPHCRLMALLTFGAQLQTIDGQAIVAYEREVANKLGPSASAAVRAGWLLDFGRRREPEDYQRIVERLGEKHRLGWSPPLNKAGIPVQTSDDELSDGDEEARAPTEPPLPSPRDPAAAQLTAVRLPAPPGPTVAAAVPASRMAAAAAMPTATGPPAASPDPRGPSEPTPRERTAKVGARPKAANNSVRGPIAASIAAKRRALAQPSPPQRLRPPTDHPLQAKVHQLRPPAANVPAAAEVGGQAPSPAPRSATPDPADIDFDAELGWGRASDVSSPMRCLGPTTPASLPLNGPSLQTASLIAELQATVQHHQQRAEELEALLAKERDRTKRLLQEGRALAGRMPGGLSLKEMDSVTAFGFGGGITVYSNAPLALEGAGATGPPLLSPALGLRMVVPSAFLLVGDTSLAVARFFDRTPVFSLAHCDVLECSLDDAHRAVVLRTVAGTSFEVGVEDDRRRYVLYKCLCLRRGEAPKEPRAPSEPLRLTAPAPPAVPKGPLPSHPSWPRRPSTASSVERLSSSARSELGGAVAAVEEEGPASHGCPPSRGSTEIAAEALPREPSAVLMDSLRGAPTAHPPPQAEAPAVVPIRVPGTRAMSARYFRNDSDDRSPVSGPSASLRRRFELEHQDSVFSGGTQWGSVVLEAVGVPPSSASFDHDSPVCFGAARTPEVHERGAGPPPQQSPGPSPAPPEAGPAPPLPSATPPPPAVVPSAVPSAVSILPMADHPASRPYSWPASQAHEANAASDGRTPPGPRPPPPLLAMAVDDDDAIETASLGDTDSGRRQPPAPAGGSGGRGPDPPSRPLTTAAPTPAQRAGPAEVPKLSLLEQLKLSRRQPASAAKAGESDSETSEPETPTTSRSRHSAGTAHTPGSARSRRSSGGATRPAAMEALGAEVPRPGRHVHMADIVSVAEAPLFSPISEDLSPWTRPEVADTAQRRGSAESAVTPPTRSRSGSLKEGAAALFGFGKKK